MTQGGYGRVDRSYRELLAEMFRAEFKMKEHSTLLGYAWNLLHPALLLVTLYVFFGSPMGSGIKYYPLYLLIGLVHYSHFAKSTGSAMVVLQSMRQLVTNTVFPKEILMLSSILANGVDFLFSMVLCVVVAWMFGDGIGWSVLLLPYVFVVQILLALGVSFVLACCYLRIRDLSNIYQVLLRVLLFISPVFYGGDYVGKGWAQSILKINPLAHLMTVSRGCILRDGDLSMRTLVGTGIFSVAIAVLGLLVFRRCERTFAHYL